MGADVGETRAGRARLLGLYDAAVEGAAPGPLTTAALRSVAPPSGGGRTHLIAVGKAAPGMVRAAAIHLDSAGVRLAGGLIVAVDDESPFSPAMTSAAGDHPVPGARSFAAARSLGDAVARVRAEDLALVLLSGGASSLLAASIDGASDAAVARLFALLLGCGLDVGAMNVVRKRFTRWGAGRLALALAPARTEVLLMSDVPGDDPAAIGSGPCWPDARTAADVAGLLGEVGLLAAIPPVLLRQLDDVRAGRAPETPKPGEQAFARVGTRVIGSNRLALEGAARAARAASTHAEIAPQPLTGHAARAGDMIARALLERAEQGRFGYVLWGGETTVRLQGGGVAPGGRCQELALAASRALAAGPTGVATRVRLLAAGTDGRDGPTDAAGAFADAGVWAAIARAGRDPARDLARHESNAALASAGALLPRRETGTNVMDVVIGVVE